MAKWRDLTIKGVLFKFDHLQPFSVMHEIDGLPAKITFMFYNHIFTDEKSNDVLLFPSEGRYWSENRYIRSLELPKLLADNFFENYAVPYRNKKGSEAYHYCEVYDYAIFFELSKPHDENRHVKVKIIVAYELDAWGKEGLPKGSAKRITWILAMKLKGQSVLKKKSRTGRPS